MIKYLLLGGGYAFAAAIQPGPLQAFLVSRVAATGWRQTLPACLAPIVSDGPIALIAILLLGRLSPWALDGLQAAGGVLLVYLAWVTFAQWRSRTSPDSVGSAPRTLLEAVLVNLLNPHPYLGWALVLGPSVHVAWQQSPSSAIALIAAFYGTMTVMLAATIIAFGTANYFGARVQRGLIGVSAGLLASLGVYLLTSALWRLATV